MEGRSYGRGRGGSWRRGGGGGTHDGEGTGGGGEHRGRGRGGGGGGTHDGEGGGGEHRGRGRGGGGGGTQHDGEGGGGEHRGRGRGGYHRSRGRKDYYRGRGRGGAAAASFTHRDHNEENRQSPECEDGTEPVFTRRRKLVSNWDRYAESEREEPADDTPTLRGTDFQALLETAGDSFTQFRFSEEKDWEMDPTASSQMAAVPLDLAALVQRLQPLPVHQRLNLEAELTQVSTPVELPSVTVAPRPDLGSRAVSFAPPPPSSRGPNTSLRPPSAGGPPSATLPPATRASAAPPPEDDEELDRLLGLDKPGLDPAEEQPAGEAVPEEVCEVPETAEVEVKLAPPTRAVPVKQEVTEDNLEDWLDSMIS